MKPIIIIKETNKGGKFELTEEELKELIEQAYKQGFEDGKQERVNIQGVPYYKFPKECEPIPCGTTTGRLNPEIKLNGSPVSTGV